MQEVFEKIIDELESEAKRWEDSGTEYKDKCEIAVGRGLRSAIEIVKKKAEKFGTDINVGSNGWIPVSERLPKRYEYVYVTCHSLCDERPNWVADTIYVDTWGIPIVDLGNAEVIAWKKKILPEPYQTKGE